MIIAILQTPLCVEEGGRLTSLLTDCSLIGEDNQLTGYDWSLNAEMDAHEKSMIWASSFMLLHKITFQKGNHSGKSYQSKELKSNRGVWIPMKVGVSVNSSR